jgi:calcineurin-like phosphoesterase family protein
MFHYPIAEWNQMHRGAVHFHGHLHGTPSGIENYRALDVGMDSTNYIVVEMEDAIKRAMRGEIKKGHQKGD